MTNPSPLEFLRLLDRHGVPFVVIGGHAVSFHGYVRATEDADLVWLRSPESEKGLLAALADAHAKWIADDIDPATRLERLVSVTEPYIRATHLMMLDTDYGFLDLFDYVPGFPDADVRQFYDQAIVSEGLRYASLDWLKRMKRASARPADRSDLENLP